MAESASNLIPYWFPIPARASCPPWQAGDPLMASETDCLLYGTVLLRWMLACERAAKRRMGQMLKQQWTKAVVCDVLA